MKDYQTKALRTEPLYEAPQSRLSNKRMTRLLHAAMGLQTEAGELTDALKRHIFYGKDLDETNLKEESGDLMWYLAILAEELGTTLEALQEQNIKKLQARFPNKFTEEDALERDLEAEREVLEELPDRIEVKIDSYELARYGGGAAELAEHNHPGYKTQGALIYPDGTTIVTMERVK